MPCNKSLDVVLLLDGSGSLGKKGWNAEIKMAEIFVDAFGEGVPQGSPSPANMAVILFSGPRTWSGVYSSLSVRARRACTGVILQPLRSECEHVETRRHIERQTATATQVQLH